MSDCQEHPARGIKNARGELPTSVIGFSSAFLPLAPRFASCEYMNVRIIAKRTLMTMAAAHGDRVEQTRQWYETARRATWQNLAEVRMTLPHADVVEGLTVFNIKGNHYRLVVHLRYDIQVIFIKQLLTHAEYDRGDWKND